MSDMLTNIRTRNVMTPQSVQADPRQKRNNAGGYTFTVSADVRLNRFLTIGTEGGTHYVERRALTLDNGSVVLDFARSRTLEMVEAVKAVSAAGRAPSNDPAILALMAAMALGETEDGRRAAEAAFNDVVRTGTHLFTAAKYREQFGGWGSIARRAFAHWYLDKDPDKLAYQLVKYRQRGAVKGVPGWSHRDVLRNTRGYIATHRAAVDQGHRDLFNWLTQGVTEENPLPAVIGAYERAQEIAKGNGKGPAKTAAYVQLIRDVPFLPWEALPDEATGQADVWRALIDGGLPVTALLRNLPKLTRLGVLAPMSEHLAKVTARLTDQALIIKGRVHPVAVLIALKTYAAGQSMRGTSTWAPVPQVTDALNDMFYLAFGAVEPAGVRTMLATDVSGSMSWPINRTSFRNLPEGFDGYPFTAGEIAGAMALVAASTEPRWGLYGFSTQLAPLNISPGMRLDSAMAEFRRMTMGGTDCALPMLWALKNRVEVDVFRIFTDNETWAGRSGHPHEALRRYRDAMGINARMQVVAVVPTEFSIAEQDDPGQMDVSGFDSATPRLLADHSAGRL